MPAGACQQAASGQRGSQPGGWRGSRPPAAGPALGSARAPSLLQRDDCYLWRPCARSARREEPSGAMQSGLVCTRRPGRKLAPGCGLVDQPSARNNIKAASRRGPAPRVWRRRGRSMGPSICCCLGQRLAAGEEGMGQEVSSSTCWRRGFLSHGSLADTFYMLYSCCPGGHRHR